jgi:hypothetical protein
MRKVRCALRIKKSSLYGDIDLCLAAHSGCEYTSQGEYVKQRIHRINLRPVATCARKT